VKNNKVIPNERKEESIFIKKEWKGGGKTPQRGVCDKLGMKKELGINMIILLNKS